MVWRRILEPEFPLVYKNLEMEQGDAEGGIARERYVIQDLPPEDDSMAVDLMVQRFLLDEPTCKSTNVSSDADAILEMHEYWMECVSQRLSIACYRLEQDGTRTLVALNLCSVSEKGEPEPDFGVLRSVAWRQILHTLVLSSKSADVYKVLGVDRYLSASGLLVLPELRGRGLAVQVIKAREPLCRAVGLEATATAFTASASQHIAEKCGFKMLGEILYKELECFGYKYPNINTPSVKLMGCRYNF